MKWWQLDNEDKIREVWRRKRLGQNAHEMAADLDVEVQHVFALARKEGITITGPSKIWPKADDDGVGFNAKSDLWGRPADKQREAIWQRARNAARARLKELSQTDAKTAERAPEPVVRPVSTAAPTYANDDFLSGLRARAGR